MIKSAPTFPKIICDICDAICFVGDKYPAKEIQAYIYRARCPICAFEGTITVTKEFMVAARDLEAVTFKLYRERNSFVDPVSEWKNEPPPFEGVSSVWDGDTYNATFTVSTSVGYPSAEIMYFNRLQAEARYEQDKIDGIVEKYKPPEPPTEILDVTIPGDYKPKRSVKVAPPIGKRKIRINGDE